MRSRFTPHLVTITYDAALRSFWRKNALASFLNRSNLGQLPTWLPEESKRDFLSRVFEKLETSDAGKRKLIELAQFLAEQTTFPDLEGWEDSADKLEAAERSVKILKSYLTEQDEQLTSEKQKKEANERFREFQAKARASQLSIQGLSDRLTDLQGDIGTQKAGKDFEAWFYDLMEFSEITSRKPYKTDGREIDGSITIGDTTYLVECKFTAEQSGAPDIDIFRQKVETKAENTMGVFVSIAGYSSVAITGASGKRTPLLLLDHSHLYRVLGGISSFVSVIERVRRHSSQTGKAYLPSNSF